MATTRPASSKPSKGHIEAAARLIRNKVKKGSEAARWPRSEITVERTKDGRVSQFAVTAAGDDYALEVTTMAGGVGAYDLFMAALAA